MDFLTEDEKKEIGLTPEQLDKITPKYNDHLAAKSKEWEGKANENAEGIITGAAKYAQSKFGVQVERNQGEKLGDYLSRIGDTAFEKTKSELDKAKSEYDQKLKDFKGDDATKEELAAAKQALDEAKKKYADYDSLKEKAEKYEPLQQELSKVKKNQAYGSVKPAFPDTVNKYEAAAVWNEFVSVIEEKYTIDIDKETGEPIAIDKENEHRILKLSELVSKDEKLSKLSEGRSQNGLNSDTKDAITLEGVPFKLPKDADSAAVSKAINEYLTNELKMSPFSDERTKKFTELHAKVKAAQAK